MRSDGDKHGGHTYLSDLHKSSEENQQRRTLIQRVKLQESDEDG